MLSSLRPPAPAVLAPVRIEVQAFSSYVIVIEQTIPVSVVLLPLDHIHIHFFRNVGLCSLEFQSNRRAYRSQVLSGWLDIHTKLRAVASPFPVSGSRAGSRRELLSPLRPTPVSGTPRDTWASTGWRVRNSKGGKCQDTSCFAFNMHHCVSSLHFCFSRVDQSRRSNYPSVSSTCPLYSVPGT